MDHDHSKFFFSASLTRKDIAQTSNVVKRDCLEELGLQKIEGDQGNLVHIHSQHNTSLWQICVHFWNLAVQNVFEEDTKVI